MSLVGGLLRLWFLECVSQAETYCTITTGPRLAGGEVCVWVVGEEGQVYSEPRRLV